MYRVFQEISNNILKHSQAKNVLIHIDYSKGLSLIVQDDGLGMNLENLENQRNGIKTIQNRLALIGFKLEIESVQGIGTQIKLAKNDSDLHYR